MEVPRLASRDPHLVHHPVRRQIGADHIARLVLRPRRVSPRTSFPAPLFGGRTRTRRVGDRHADALARLSHPRQKSVDRAGRVRSVAAVGAEKSLGTPVVVRRRCGGGRRLEAADVAPVRAGGGAGDGRARRHRGGLRDDVAGGVGGVVRVGREAPRLGRRGWRQEGHELAEEEGRRPGHLFPSIGLTRFAELFFNQLRPRRAISRSPSTLCRHLPFTIGCKSPCNWPRRSAFRFDLALLRDVDVPALARTNLKWHRRSVPRSCFLDGKGSLRAVKYEGQDLSAEERPKPKQ